MDRFGTLRACVVSCMAAGLAACTVPDLELEGRACPCLSDYVCVDGKCLKPEHVPDASTQAQDAGQADAGDLPCELADTRPCGTDVGECMAGVQVCGINGTWGDCTGGVGPEAETCDNADNDCNGKTDENSAGPCEKTVGVCAGSLRDCVAGAPEVTCPASRYGADYQAAETACDGKDNDCDGKTDVGLVGSACEKTAGVCAGAKRICAGGAWEATCVAADYGLDYEADESRCDGKDNDCDGQTDEAVRPTGQCELQLGVCEGSLRACVQGAFETPCTLASYPLLYTAGADDCDGLDNDCNGTADDGFLCVMGATAAAGCTTACGTNGTEVCNAACDGYDCAPPPEACNGVDDDCDGKTDLGLNSGFLTLTSGESALPAIGVFGQPGTGFAVAWAPAAAGGAINVQRVDLTGALPAATVPAAVPGGATTMSAPVIAGGVVAWIEAKTKVRGSTLDQSGRPGAPFDIDLPLDQPTELSGAALSYPTLAWTSNNTTFVAQKTGTGWATKNVLGAGASGPTLARGAGGEDLVIAVVSSKLAVANITQADSAFLDLTATGPTLAPSGSDGAVAYVVPGPCAGTCPPGQTSASKIVVGALLAGSPVTMGATLDVTDAATVFAEQPRLAFLGQGIYLVVYRQFDASGNIILGTNRLHFDSGGGAWTKSLPYGLTRAPSHILSAAAAGDGLHFGIVLDEVDQSSQWHALFRSTCP